MITLFIDVFKSGERFLARCSSPEEVDVVIPIGSASDPVEALKGMLELVAIGLNHEGGDLYKYVRKAEPGKEEPARYSLAQIREAFWRQFKGAGELWFPYQEGHSYEVDENSAVESEWTDFAEKLQGVTEKL